MTHDIRMTAAKIAQRLTLIEPLVYRRRLPLPPFQLRTFATPAETPASTLPPDAAETVQITPPVLWGSPELNFALYTGFTIPPEFGSAYPVAMYLPLGEAANFSHPEALVYIDGATAGTVDRHHQEFQLPRAVCDGQPHQLMLHGWTGLATQQNPGGALWMQECAVVEVDPDTRQLVILARNALQTANLLDSAEPAKTRLYNALDEAFKRLDTREPFGAQFYASVPKAVQILRRRIAMAGGPLDAEIIAAGHAHIDVAWLWTLGQTRRKAGRTFQTVLNLMEQFPNYHFTQSQPQLYDYIRQDYPQIFEGIKTQVAEGRWEPIGGMWVEADCNITGPESLARQFLLGRSFFREHFGADAESQVLWLPDVFGYAWNLPQLIKLAGMEYFFTIKIGWNQVNKMPFDSFWWQGLDGTKVLTHFSTAPEHPYKGEADAASLMNSATYNANLDPFTTLGSWVKLKHKESQHVMLMSYGYGDGGGGPTREMNENAQVLAEFPALPRVTQGKVIDFFHRLEEESGSRLPTWNSELYLEIHRGTYTTQSRNKRANRKSEFLLHDAEFAAAFASVLDPTFDYPHASLNQAWQLVCLNQFHDIIPGSSIHAVYEESQAQYAEIRRLAESARDSALDVIRQQAGGDVVLMNPTSFIRDDLAYLAGEIPSGKILTYGNHPVPAQPTAEGILIDAGEIAPYSLVSLTWEHAGASQPPTHPLHIEPHLLENDFLRVELNDAGDITRIYDKTMEREVLPEGTVANQWQAFEDRPLNWDAWDIDIFYDDKLFLAEPAESIQVVESGPLRATLEIKRRILNSLYTQRISLVHNRRQLDFDTTIDWRERHILLKAAFPVDILAPVATCEIQWGHVQRPTHRNTSWDQARFETCAQKWVELSENNFGVALLNDCKYGHDIHDNVIRISLLRAPTYPDPEADQGEHRFAYSLLLDGSATTSVNPYQIAARAYALNDPLIALSGSKQSVKPLTGLVSVSGSAIIETVKQAENGEGIIVRLYQSERRRETVAVTAGFAVKAAWITNLLEEDQEAVTVANNRIALPLKPFQIVTLRLIPE